MPAIGPKIAHTLAPTFKQAAKNAANNAAETVATKAARPQAARAVMKGFPDQPFPSAPAWKWVVAIALATGRRIRDSIGNLFK